MAGQKHFLRTPYGAYHNPPTPKVDAELTHVERGSACGEYLRRFWQPVANRLRGGRASVQGCACSARTWCCSGPARAIGGCSTSTAAIAGPRSNTAWSSREACAAAITAGCSRPTEASWRRPESRRRARSRTGFITAPTRSRSMADWSSPIWARPTGGPNSRPTTPSPCPTTGWCPITSPTPATGSRCRKT